MSSAYDKIRGLLATETYPHRYIHKFIGVKSADFLESVTALEQKYPKATRVSEREKTNAQGLTYLALTYEFNAETPEEIVALLQTTALLNDLKVIL